MAADDSSDSNATTCFNPWGAALPESVQFIVFDFVVPGRRTYDKRGRRVLRDTMNDTSETLCDDRVESSPLWDLKLHATGRAWRAALKLLVSSRKAWRSAREPGDQKAWGSAPSCRAAQQRNKSCCTSGGAWRPATERRPTLSVITSPQS